MVLLLVAVNYVVLKAEFCEMLPPCDEKHKAGRSQQTRTQQLLLLRDDWWEGLSEFALHQGKEGRKTGSASPSMMQQIRELCPKAGGKFERPSQRSARNSDENGNKLSDKCSGFGFFSAK